MRTKSRLTITLPPDLVERLDGMVDHQTVRNRSHAIELLIRQGLMPEVTTAIVLAGGEHQGIGNPALAPVGGQALILLTLRHLVGFGIRNVLLLAGRHEPEIREVLGNGEGLGVSIEYLAEKRPLGTAGALKSAESHLPDSPVLVVHGDVLTDIDISELISFHLSEGCLATMAVKPRNAEKDCGQVMLQGNRISYGLAIEENGLFQKPRSHIRIVRPAATFWCDPVDVLVRVFDIAGFAVDAVLRVDHEFGLCAFFLNPFVNARRAIAC